MARDSGNQHQVYLLVTDENQPAPIQINGEGQARLLEASDPINLRSKETGAGTGVNFYNEKGEIEDGVLLTDYHLFLDENNEVFSVPPGSIVQGRFKVTKVQNVTEKSESDTEVSKAEILQDADVAMLPAEDISIIQSSSINSSDLYVPMEDIELEEEIVSNDSTGHLSSKPSNKRDSRHDEIKNSIPEEKHGNHYVRGRRRKRSIQETMDSSKDITNASADINSSISNHHNQIDQLVEIAEAELLPVESPDLSLQSNVLKDVPLGEGLLEEVQKSLQKKVDASFELIENVPNNLISSEPSSKPLEPPLSVESNPNFLNDECMDDLKNFMKGYVLEIADLAIRDVPECLPPSTCNEKVGPAITSEISCSIEHTKSIETVKTSEALSPIKTNTDSSPVDNMFVCTEPIKWSDHIGSHVPNLQSSSPDITPIIDVITDAFREIKTSSVTEASEIQHSVSSGNDSIIVPKSKSLTDDVTVKDSVDMKTCGITEGICSGASGLVSMSNLPMPLDEVSCNIEKEMVDKEVQVESLTSVKVIRVSCGWDQPSFPSRNEITSRDVARQKRELDALSIKLKAMERELEVRMTNLKREQSRLEMAKRSFLIEKAKEKHLLAKNKEEVKKGRSVEQKHDLAENVDKNSKVFIQNTYVGRPRKRKSETAPSNVPPSKTPRHSTGSRGLKVPINCS